MAKGDNELVFKALILYSAAESLLYLSRRKIKLLSRVESYISQRSCIKYFFKYQVFRPSTLCCLFVLKGDNELVFKALILDSTAESLLFSSRRKIKLMSKIESDISEIICCKYFFKQRILCLQVSSN